MNKYLFHIFKTLVCSGYPDKADKDYQHKLRLWCNNLHTETLQVIKDIDAALEERARKTTSQSEFLVCQGRFLLLLKQAIPRNLGQSKRYLVEDCINTILQHLDNRFKSLSKAHSDGLLAKIKELDTSFAKGRIKQISTPAGNKSYRQQLYPGALSDKQVFPILINH